MILKSLFSLTLILGISYSQTVLPDTLTTNLTSDGNPYYLVNNIYIVGDTLDIEEGVEIYVNPGNWTINIIDSSIVNFNGTLDSPITILPVSGSSPSAWSGITINDSEINMSYTIIEGTDTGVEFSQSNVNIVNSEFNYNRNALTINSGNTIQIHGSIISNNTGRALNTSRGSDVLISSCQFIDNNVGDTYETIFLDVYQPDLFTFKLYDSVISNNTAGNVIKVMGGDNSSGEMSIEISGCDFRENSGNVIYFETLGRKGADILIERNYFVDNSEIGIYYYSYENSGGAEDQQKNITIQQNTFYGNDIAILTHRQSSGGYFEHDFHVSSNIIAYNTVGIWYENNTIIHDTDIVYNLLVGNDINIEIDSSNPSFGSNSSQFTNLNGLECDIFLNMYEYDPLFIDSATYNLGLESDSPCIDAGDLTIGFDSDGTFPDIGAYYYNQDQGPDDIYGCTDPTANNYNSDATIDDGTCEYDDCEEVFNEGYELGAQSGDINLDGLHNVLDIVMGVNMILNP